MCREVGDAGKHVLTPQAMSKQVHQSTAISSDDKQVEELKNGVACHHTLPFAWNRAG